MRTPCKTSNSLYTVFFLNEGFALYSLRLPSELKGKETNNGHQRSRQRHIALRPPFELIRHGVL